MSRYSVEIECWLEERVRKMGNIFRVRKNIVKLETELKEYHKELERYEKEYKDFLKDGLVDNNYYTTISGK